MNEFTKPGARLLVTSRDEAGRDTVEVAHEALIGAWGQLQKWLAESLELRFWRQRLEPSLQYWERDPTNVLQGLALAEAERWSHERRAELLPKEVALLEASVDSRTKQAKEARERQERDLDAANALAIQSEARARAEEAAREQAEARERAEAAARHEAEARERAA